MNYNFFASSYDEARSRFRTLAADRGASIETFALPELRGPMREELATDAAMFGGSDADSALIISSGTHGIEGYAGSGCQADLLSGDLISRIAEKHKVILIHAVNPFGFAYGRRTNENNIDLNRNFIDFSAKLPENPAYPEAAAKFMPRTAAISDYEKTRDYIATRVAEQGPEFLRDIFQPGQYVDQKGLFFGGKGPAWSNLTFRSICDRLLEGCDRVVAIDLHTGLGPIGVGELIFLGENSSVAQGAFSGPVSIAGGEGSVSAAVSGPLVSAIREHTDARVLITGALEFGTRSVEDVFSALIYDNWAYHYLTPGEAHYHKAREAVRSAFYCEGDPKWQANLLARFNTIIQESWALLETTD
jgi:hypothetical protein